MNYPVELTGSVTPGNPDSPPVVAPQNELSEILKQILEIQKEMLAISGLHLQLMITLPVGNPSFPVGLMISPVFLK